MGSPIKDLELAAENSGYAWMLRNFNGWNASFDGDRAKALTALVEDLLGVEGFPWSGDEFNEGCLLGYLEKSRK